MKHLEPLMTYLSPFLTARVFIPRDVGAGVRLGQAEGGQLRLLAEHPEVLLLGLLGAAEGDRRRGEAVGHQRGADARAAPAHLLLDQAAGEVVEAGAAVGLGDVGVHQPDLPGLVDHVLRPGAVLVVLPGDVAHLFLGEAVGQLAQILLLVGQGEVNHRSVLLFRPLKSVEAAAGAPSRRAGAPPIDWSVNQREG